MLMGGGGFAALGPVGVAAGAAPFVVPPLARALMFRNGAQQALVNETPQASQSAKMLANLLSNGQAQQLLMRGAPVIGAQ